MCGKLQFSVDCRTVKTASAKIQRCPDAYYSVIWNGRSGKASAHQRTPSILVSQGTLSASKGYSVEGTNKNGGYGNTYAQASMSFNGVTYTITATD